MLAISPYTFGFQKSTLTANSLTYDGGQYKAVLLTTGETHPVKKDNCPAKIT